MALSKQFSSKFIIFTCLTALLIVSGCTGANKKGTAADAGQMPVYYDFEDVLIPKELKVITKDSFVYTTAGITAGVVALKGRVDGNSLIDFFENNMPRDGWSQISAFKSPRTLLLFRKETRWCAIILTEKSFKTYVEIWVSPTQSDLTDGLLKE
jgi:hypothetical protein